MDISVFGIGKLGIAFSAGAASYGHGVIGVDVNEELVESVNDGTAPFPEPRLQETLNASGDNFRATTNYAEAIHQTSVSFVFVPTPSTDNGDFDNKFVYDTLDGIADELAKKDSYHLIVLCSTVSPGSCSQFESFLEEATGTPSGDNWGLCYNPAFISQGTIIHDFYNPEILLLGESDRKAGDKLMQFWDSTLQTSPVISRMNFINTEIAKIAFNVFSTIKISFANQMALLCGQHDGANVDAVMNSIKQDRRIGGEKLFMGGLGFGGPCLPRDNSAFRAFADLPSAIDIQKRTDNLNDAIPEVVQDIAERIADDDDTFGVLGLTYKPGTHITKESQATEIAHSLESTGYDVLTYDPMAEERTCDDIDSVLERADLILILTPWPEFEAVPSEQLAEKKVFDAWRMHSEELSGEDNYYAFGVDEPTSLPDTLDISY